MTYLQHKALKPDDFKRLCGVHQATFTQMVNVVIKQVEQKKKKPGKPSKLSVEDQVLMSLEYWREYRTYFHISQSWGVHEATVCRIVTKVENALIGSGKFQLPGKGVRVATEQKVTLRVECMPVKRFSYLISMTPVGRRIVFVYVNFQVFSFSGKNA